MSGGILGLMGEQRGTGLLGGVDDILDPKSPSYSRRHGGGLITGLLDSLYSGVTLPRDVYQGKVDLNTNAAADRVLDMTGLVMGGGLGAAKATGVTADGATLGIVPIPVARRIDMPVTTHGNSMLAEAVPNTPGARLTPDGLEMSVQRMQKEVQGGEESVRTGVFYLPEGASQMKHYKNHRPTEVGTYGGQVPIEGETLYKNPLVVKGATGGKAPEAAYDQLLNSKGAYQAMRNDALHAVAPSWARLDYGDQVSLVERFIKQYAPDQAGTGFAEHVLANSKGGNLLPYALQELAVAHAARKAGYDAVIGTTKAKGQPILSEVFDVREKSYPTPEGDFELMPQFEGLLR